MMTAKSKGKTSGSAETSNLAKRWTPILNQKGWTPVSNYFLMNYHRLKPYRLTHGEAMLVIHLMYFKRDEKPPYPGFPRLARYMGISAQAARNLARSLSRKGYLHRELRRGETNRFFLGPLFQALEKLLQEDEQRKAKGGGKVPVAV
jgi:hypothetical protein